MKHQAKRLLIFSLFVLPLLVGCKQLDSFSREGTAPSDAVTGNTGVSFEFDFSSLHLSQDDLSSNFVEQFDDGSATYFTGTVRFQLLPSGPVNTYSISAAVDGTFQARLDQTMALQGGQYDVSVIFSDANQEYYGTASNVTVAEDTTNNIDITIHPVFGDSIMTGDIASTIALYDFQYDSSDFDTASDTYHMMVYIDGDSGTYLTFDEFTENASLYLNNITDSTQIKIEVLKDGSPAVVIARYEGIPGFTAGTDQTLNLTPIFGTSTFTLTEAGGDAVFNLKILQETYSIVHSETGGNFEFRFSAVGPNNTIPEEVLTFQQDTANDWVVSRTYNSFQYDTMNADVKVVDTGASREIGNCSFTVNLSKNQTPVSCDLTLERRATVSGEVLQVLGVNVVKVSGETAPAGTSIYVDGVFRKLTGGTGETDGYANLFLEPGVTHSIHAVDTVNGTSSAPTPYSAESWKVDNILLWLDQ